MLWMPARSGQLFLAGKFFSMVNVWYYQLVHMLFMSGEGGLITKRKHIGGKRGFFRSDFTLLMFEKLDGSLVSDREAWKAVGSFDEARTNLEKHKWSFSWIPFL
jgi:hypothetical protein